MVILFSMQNAVLKYPVYQDAYRVFIFFPLSKSPMAQMKKWQIGMDCLSLILSQILLLNECSGAISGKL